MNGFELILQDASQRQVFSGVISFVGEDASGSFGIQSGHARIMTSLVMGLARFRNIEQDWQYIATPGALLYFHDDMLTLTCHHFLIDADYMRISQALQQQILEEEAELQAQKNSLRRMEEEVLRRLWDMSRSEV